MIQQSLSRYLVKLFMDYVFHQRDTSTLSLSHTHAHSLTRTLSLTHTLSHTHSLCPWTVCRYLVKLFMDYVFHQRDDQDRPVIEFGFIVQVTRV